MTLRAIGWAMLAALALMAASASSASATTLEVEGVAENTETTFTADMRPTALETTWWATNGVTIEKCSGSHLQASTVSPFHGATVTAPVTSLTFTGCPEAVVVDNPGQLIIEWIPSSTDGTVRWENTEVTVSYLGLVVACKSTGKQHVGTLTWAGAGGHSTLYVQTVLSCGLIPTMTWVGTYFVTSPTGLGVVA